MQSTHASIIQQRRFNIEQFDLQLASVELIVDVAERRGSGGYRAYLRAQQEFERVRDEYVRQLTTHESESRREDIDGLEERLARLSAQWRNMPPREAPDDFERTDA